MLVAFDTDYRMLFANLVGKRTCSYVIYLKRRQTPLVSLFGTLSGDKDVGGEMMQLAATVGGVLDTLVEESNEASCLWR